MTERLSLPEKLGFITSPKAHELKIPTARPKVEPVSQTFDLFRPVYIFNNYIVYTTVNFWKSLGFDNHRALVPELNLKM